VLTCLERVAVLTARPPPCSSEPEHTEFASTEAPTVRHIDNAAGDGRQCSRNPPLFGAVFSEPVNHAEVKPCWSAGAQVEFLVAWS